MADYRVPAVNWGEPLDNVLGAAETGDRILVANEAIQSFAQQAAARVGKSDVEVVVENERDA